MPARRQNAQTPGFELVVIIASAGGLPAMSALLAGIPPAFPVPLLVLQHRRPTTHQDALASLLSMRTALPVRSACEGMPVRLPGVTVIPPGYAATAGADGLLHLRLRDGLPGPDRNIGDDLAASAAATSGSGGVIGVVLSGRMNDGSKGVRAVKRHGGRVLVQDPATAQAPEMPASAIATGCVDFILSPDRMPSALIALAMAPGGAQLLTVPTPHWAQLGA